MPNLNLKENIDTRSGEHCLFSVCLIGCVVHLEARKETQPAMSLCFSYNQKLEKPEGFGQTGMVRGRLPKL